MTVRGRRFESGSCRFDLVAAISYSANAAMTTLSVKQPVSFAILVAEPTSGECRCRLHGQSTCRRAGGRWFESSLRASESSSVKRRFTFVAQRSGKTSVPRRLPSGRKFYVGLSLTGKAPHCECGRCGFNSRSSTQFDRGSWIYTDPRSQI